jgi:hypothetical protein
MKHLQISALLNVYPQVAHQQSLEKLYLLYTSLQELPGDIGNLSSLEQFIVGSPFLKILPCSPEQLEGLAAHWLQGIEIFAQFVGTVDSAVRAVHKRLWNTVLIARSGEVEQPRKVNSTKLSDTRATIEKGGGRRKRCH